MLGSVAVQSGTWPLRGQRLPLAGAGKFEFLIRQSLCKLSAWTPISSFRTRVEIATGFLGHVLPIGIGHALAGKIR